MRKLTKVRYLRMYHYIICADQEACAVPCPEYTCKSVECNLMTHSEVVWHHYIHGILTLHVKAQISEMICIMASQEPHSSFTMLESLLCWNIDSPFNIIIWWNVIDSVISLWYYSCFHQSLMSISPVKVIQVIFHKVDISPDITVQILKLYIIFFQNFQMLKNSKFVKKKSYILHLDIFWFTVTQYKNLWNLYLALDSWYWVEYE